MIAAGRKASTSMCDKAGIVRAFEAFVPPGGVVELRAIKAKTVEDRYAGTVSGYFDNGLALAEAVAMITEASGIYITANPVNPALLARAVNKARRVQSEPTTSDHDIPRRRWLLIDCDAVRPAGISASDAEHEAALAKAQEIKSYLAQWCWPAPLEGDSGNGAHLCYRIDLPADDGGLVNKCLLALSSLFTDERVKVDTSVHNAARIWKLYGTIACKGDNDIEHGRPHRMAKLLAAPDELQVVPQSLLEELVGDVLDDSSCGTQEAGAGDGTFDIEQWIHQHGLEVQATHERGGTTIWVLERCVWNSDHTDKSAWIGRRASGAIVAGCRHNSCQGRGWHDLRAKLDPAWAERRSKWEKGRNQTDNLSVREQGGDHGGRFVPKGQNDTLVNAAEKSDGQNVRPNAAKSDHQNDGPNPADSSGPPWPAPLGPAAYHGPIGDLVRALEPHSESDPAALLVQSLVAFGSAVGRNAYYQVEGSKHYPNLFATLVGKTAAGRKGTSWGRIEDTFAAIAPNWKEHCIASGLSSGEGLIHAVRDEATKQEPIRDKGFSGKQRNGPITGYETVLVDPGVKDKRLLCTESEFGGVLRVMQRQSNTLSVLIRQCWDTGNLRTLTKNNSTKATGAHVSIVGHITGPELRKFLLLEDAFGGVGNRFLWVCTQRSKLLPLGGRTVDVWSPTQALGAALKTSIDRGEMQFDLNARTVWCDVYGELSSGRPGLLGACTSRAEAQVVRLALVYALADGADAIALEHLRAALEVWRYCFDSAKYIFGNSTGDATADAILAELTNRGAAGLGRTEIVRMFGNNRPATTIDGALALLQGIGVARSERVSKEAGRPEVRWYAC